MTLPELAIKRHVTTLMIIVSLIVLGLVSLSRLPLAFLPDFERPDLFVEFPYANASPDQIERMIIRPAEEVLGSMRNLKEMHSDCHDGGGMVRLEFDWSTNMNIARVEAWEKIDRIRRDLPADLGDIQVGSHWDNRGADMPILEGRLSSKRDLSASWDLLENKIVRPLERVPGVAVVRMDGVNPREVKINIKLNKLEAHGIDIRTVKNLLRTGNFNQSLGQVRTDERVFTLRAIASFNEINEIKALPVRSDGLRLEDIAEVVYAEPPLEYGRHLDGDFAIGITISQESKANTVEVCQAIEARIAEMNADPDLEGVNFLVWFSQGREIKKTLSDLTFTGLFGAVLASIVLFLFLKRVSTTIVAVLCIPFALIVTCGVIWAQGKSLNTLTLLGLIVGIGMLVDNAVVVMENIFRHRESGLEHVKASLIGAREVSIAVTTATLTSVIVFLPLLFNKPSEMNLYLKELGITVCLTLLASLFISQTLIPLATSWFIRAEPKPRSRIMIWTETWYERILRSMLRRRWLTPVIAVLIAVSALYPFFRVDLVFDMAEQELFVQVRYRFSEEPSLSVKEEYVNKVEAVIEPYRLDWQVRSVYSFWGDAWTFTRIYLKEGQANQQNLDRVRQQLKEILPELAGIKLEVMENQDFWRFDRGKRIAFQIVGEDYEVLTSLADEAKKRLETVPGLHDPFSGEDETNQEIHVEPDRDLVSQMAISPSQLADVIGLTFRGHRLQRFRSEDGEREMRLTLDEQDMESVSQLRNLPLWTEAGVKIPLASLADFREVRGAKDIHRDNRLTSIWVGAKYQEGTREQYMVALKPVIDGLEFPLGYSWTFGRWEQRQQEKSREFLVNLLLALLLIFAVMASLFESVRQAIALMIALPFALSGAIWTLWLTNTDFDQPAAVGVLLLIGVVVNNGIVMIEHINTYRRQGIPRAEAIVKGGRERLRPILMTAITTLISLVPIVIQKPSLAGVYYYSMAFVIMGGLLVSTFLTSVLLPTTLTIIEDIPEKLKILAQKRVKKALFLFQ
ncbi:efflux RND transporter permease subunit [bacterium]|nr:efflux RND transporter permease subunit [bacterium]